MRSRTMPGVVHHRRPGRRRCRWPAAPSHPQRPSRPRRGRGDGLARQRRRSRRRPAAPGCRTGRDPSWATPRSLTTTCAPCRANSSACARPEPTAGSGHDHHTSVTDTHAAESDTPSDPGTNCRSRTTTDRAHGSTVQRADHHALRRHHVRHRPVDARRRPGRRRRGARASTRSGSPSTPTSPPAAAPPHPPATPSWPRSTSARSTRWWRWPPPRRSPPAIHLGTGVMLPAQREPLVTAKAIATLQNLSGGRFELGIGFGWNEDEMEDHGVDYRTRRRARGPRARAGHAGPVARRGGVVPRASTSTFPPTWSWPKPEAPVPGADRRRRRAQDVRPHRRVRRRLDPDRRRRPDRVDPALPRRGSRQRAATPTRCASCRSARTRPPTSSSTSSASA